MPARWVTADEVYGGNPSLRVSLETQRMSYVLAVRCTESLQPPDGAPTPAKLLAARVGPERWLTINAGDGAKGKRWYAWTRVPLAADGAPAGWGRWLLVRRSLATGELAFYRCAASAATSLAALARVAGCRWRIEESFQATKGLCGLDQHQVRSWYRWTTLAMLADAFLVVVAHTERTQHPPPPGVIALPATRSPTCSPA